MSNIILHTTHTTPALKNDTNFVNLFLDNILESYCSKRFIENTAYPNLRLPTLSDLITEVYPDYYIKSYGLLGHKTSTNVLKIYNEDLHFILVNALEHKLSRLFINVSNSVPELKLGRTATLDVERASTVPFISIDRLYSILSTRSIHKLKAHHFHNLIMTSSQRIFINESKPQLVYKPNLESIKLLSESIKQENENVFYELDFFDIRSAYKSDLIIRIAFSINKSGHQILSSSLSPDFYDRLIEMSAVIVSHVFSKIDQIKHDIIEQERQFNERIEKERRYKEKEQERKLKELEETMQRRRHHVTLNYILADFKNKKESTEFEYKEVLMSPVDVDRKEKDTFTITHKDFITGLIVAALIIIPPSILIFIS